jgi:hypothetical protein
LHSSCDEKSLGSKERRSSIGRKFEGGSKVVYKNYEQQSLHIEINILNVASEDWPTHPAFIKLLNILKDEIDRMMLVLNDLKKYSCLVSSLEVSLNAL